MISALKRNERIRTYDADAFIINLPSELALDVVFHLLEVHHVEEQV
jgi:hypothetical protein